LDFAGSLGVLIAHIDQPTDATTSAADPGFNLRVPGGGLVSGFEGLEMLI